MSHIEMKAMEKFPVEKLSYDLKLELLEDMDPSDVIKLVNVNQGFRSIVVREPWRIFGKHVDSIWISNETDFGIVKLKSGIFRDGGRLAIRRYSDACWESSSNLITLKAGSILFSKIRSCQRLKLSSCSKDQAQETAEISTMPLRNLASVGELKIFIDSPEANIEESLRILTLNHIDSTTLYSSEFKMNEQRQGVLSNFVETKLKHCKSIDISDRSLHYSFWYEPLSKIWTEMIVFDMSFPHNEVEYESLVDRIVTTGIPSSNTEAAILLSDCWYAELEADSITGLLSQKPGIRQIAHQDRGEVQEILEKMLLDELVTKFFPYYVNEFRRFLLEGVYFTRSIDLNRKSIYVTESFVADPRESCTYFFLAKYITIG